MSRFPLFLLIIVGTVFAFGCANGSSDSPVTPGTAAGVPENHTAWGVFDVAFDIDNGSASIIWNREVAMHLNVTGAITPPKCYTCVTVADMSYDTFNGIFYLQMAFTNPMPVMGYDVRAVISNPGGQKFLINPDGVTSVWGTPMQFKAINVDPERTFGGYEVHGRLFAFDFPAGENFQTLTYIVDASWPGHVEEPLVEEGFAEPLVNNGFSTTSIRTRVFDHQGDLNPATVMADLMAFGGGPQTILYDDGQHNDLGVGDGVFGSDQFSTTADVATYMINVYAVDTTGHMGWGQVPLSVVEKSGSGENHDPVIDDVVVDRTTANGGQNEKCKITVTAHDEDGGPMGYNFEASSGSFSDGANDYEKFWKPTTSNTGPQQITITVLDDSDGMDQKQFNLWSTNLPDKGDMPSGTLPSIVPVTTLHMPDDMYRQVCYINIWATWCGWCVTEMPDLTALYNKYKSYPGYNQIFLNLQEPESTAMNFINSHNYACTYWAMDSSGSYFGQLKAFNGGQGGIPQHFLFDRDNVCRYSKIGAYTSGTTELENAIDQLL